MQCDVRHAIFLQNKNSLADRKLPINGFILQAGDNSREANVLLKHCLLRDIPLKRVPRGVRVFPEGYVPSGTVEWCEQVLGRRVTPHYYPSWLSHLLHRRVWRSDTWEIESPVFVKPADRYKRFTGFVTKGGYWKKKKPPFWYSDVVSFSNEWRYYIADGRVLTGEWYLGDEEKTPDAPPFPVEVPEGYCGAVDLGTLPDGTLALVEANHPYACGWYGRNHELYVEWLVAGWKYMQNTERDTR